MSEELKNALKVLIAEAANGTQFQFTDANGTSILVIPSNAQCTETLDGGKTVQIW